jgi:pyrroline-5-carboxylate reductase
MLKTRKIGFIGVGHMGQAMVRALVESKTIAADHIWVTNRTPGKALKMQEAYGVHVMKTNEELVDQCDVIIIAVKPQDLADVIEPIASSFGEHHVVISLAAGFSLKSLKKLLPSVKGLVRVMPNTPASIRQAVVGYCLGAGAGIYQGLVEDLLSPLGLVVPTIEGEMFEALTVGSGSGPGFVLEFMQYWQEWLEEHGFDAPTARAMTVQTFLGAATMAHAVPQTSLQELQERVVSKKGVTSAGLQSMRELEIERALRYSFEKAVLRDQELSKETAKS